ncbi:MAG: adenosine kinase [Planctomycetota bacterium]
MPRYDVFGIGNALVDIQAEVSEKFLTAVRFPKGGMTLVDEETQGAVLTALKEARGEDFAITRCAGASAANTVAGVADLGGRAAYCGKVGDDELGGFFLKDMRELGVAIEVPPAAEKLTGTCVCLITPDAERTMLTSLSVSGALAADDVDAAEIADSEYLYVEGYLFAGDSTRAAAERAIECAVEAKTKIAFTVSDPFLIDIHRQKFLELIKGPVDLLFCNLEEARALTTLDDPVACAHELHRHCANVCLTMGGDGSLIMLDGQVVPIEGTPVDAVDTTGAGDNYAAGVLYGITNGYSWKQAGRIGNRIAAEVVAKFGARLGRRVTAEEVAEIAGE